MITAQTTTFYKDIQKLMRSKGYKYKRTLASATEELTWSKPGCKDICLSGWHGTKGWGPQRILLDLYVVDSFKAPIVATSVVDVLGDTDNYGSLLAVATSTYQTKLNQIKRKILDQIG